MTKTKERLTQWLRDAHAMEEQAETMISSQASRIENYPELRERFSLHLEETRRQAKRVSECLERMGKARRSQRMQAPRCWRPPRD